MRVRRRGGSAGRVAALAWVAAAVAACGGGGPIGSIPGVVSSAVPSTLPSNVAQVTGGAATAATRFLDDMQKGLCPAAFALVTDPLKTEASNPSGLCSLEPTGASYAVGETTTLTSTSAFVAVTLGIGGQERAETLTMLAPSSAWMVSEVNIGAPSSPGAGSASLGGIIASVEQQYAASDGGTNVTITCPQSSSSPVTAGQQFTCSYSDASGKSGTLTIHVDSDHGSFHWTIP